MCYVLHIENVYEKKIKRVNNNKIFVVRKKSYMLKNTQIKKLNATDIHIYKFFEIF